MKLSRRHLSVPLDFRFLDLFFIMLVSGSAILVSIEFGRSSPLQIQTSMFATAYAGVAFQQELCGTGGTPPYKWVARSLPIGLSLAPSGVITGLPAGPGRFQPEVTLSDVDGHTVTKSFTEVVKAGVVAWPLKITTARLPAALMQSSYDLTLAAEGGVLPYKWSVDQLPTGFRLDGGRVVGFPTHEGSSSITVGVTDAINSATSRILILSVGSAPAASTRVAEPLEISDLLPPGLAGIPYLIQLSARGGQPPYRWSLVRPVRGTGVSSKGVFESKDPGLWSDEIPLKVQVKDSIDHVATRDIFPRLIRPKSTWTRALYAASIMAVWVAVVLNFALALSGRTFRVMNRSVSINFAAAVGLFLVAVVIAFNPAMGTITILAAIVFWASWLVLRND